MNMSKKILSWDVGIKNLAYCIAEFDKDSFKILKWDIINLLDDRLKCCHTLRGGKSCGKIAKHVFKIKELEDYVPTHYCKTHVGKADYKIVLPLDEVKCCKCKKEAIKIVDGTNYGWCEKHLEKQVGVYKRRCVKKIDQSCTKQSLVKLGQSMFEKLDEIPEMMKVDEVLIENQPVLKNPTMKTVACMLLSYFIMRGVYEDKGSFGENSINFVSASGKLKVNKKDSNKQLKRGKNEKDVYNITKGLSVKYTKAIISDKDLKHLNTYKKKDDLCDALLQAVRVYYSDDIPQDIADKLKTVSEETTTKKVPKDEPEETPKKKLTKKKPKKNNKNNKKAKTTKRKKIVRVKKDTVDDEK